MVPADLILLEGRALADESLLTGESVPITKQSIHNVDKEQIIDADLINVKNVVLFAGTKLIETTSEKNKNRIKCVVLRTGRFTTQGQLIANIVSFMNKTDSASLDSIYIVMMMLFFGMMAGGYTLYDGIVNPKKTRFKLVIKVIQIVTNTLPPELPLLVGININSTVAKLREMHIFTTDPFRLQETGKIR
mmetsp:Transcript_23698/g.19884  ORF Transcript_23698/g.19884 Transcript_23698/m.19884 type:complete len:190 (+) Transcript_23698:809-1378(+)